MGLAVTACGASLPTTGGSATPPPFVCAVATPPSLAICTLPADTPVGDVPVAEAQGGLVDAPRTATVRYCHGVGKGRPEVVLGAPADSTAAVALCEREFPNLRTPAPGRPSPSASPRLGVTPSGNSGDALNSIWK